MYREPLSYKVYTSIIGVIYRDGIYIYIRTNGPYRSGYRRREVWITRARLLRLYRVSICYIHSVKGWGLVFGTQTDPISCYMYYMETYTRLNYKVASWRCHRDLNGGSSLLRIFLLCVCRVIHESRDSTLGITRKTAQRVCLFPPRAKAHMHVLLCVYLPLVAVFLSLRKSD